MTESEAIEKLEFLNEALNFQRHDADECSCALQMGMDAIKEIQQYRAIGKVEEVQWMISTYNDMMHDFGDDMLALKEYRAIGTVEQIMNMQFTTESEHDEVLRYRAIGTVSEFRELKEKEERFDRNIKMFNDIGCDIAKEARAKAIDEFAEALRQECLNSPYKEVWLHTMLKIANELKNNSNEVKGE